MLTFLVVTPEETKDPESDIDFLIYLGRPIDLIEFIRLKAQLQNALGKQIDLVTDGTIIPYFEPDINKDLISIYE